MVNYEHAKVIVDSLKAQCEQLRAENAQLRAERDAYKKAKEENDERFMRERDEARAERDEAQSRLAEYEAKGDGVIALVKERDCALKERDEARAHLGDAHLELGTAKAQLLEATAQAERMRTLLADMPNDHKNCTVSSYENRRSQALSSPPTALAQAMRGVVEAAGKMKDWATVEGHPLAELQTALAAYEKALSSPSGSEAKESGG
jgi:chromosome segregation ATPase